MRSPGYCVLSLLLLTLLCACDLLPKPGVKSFQKKMVIDADHGFAVTLPLDWEKRTVSRRHPWQERMVRWEAPGTSGVTPVRFEVVLFRPEEAVGGFVRLEKELLLASPEITITSRSDLPEARYPTRRLTAYSPSATLEIRLITTLTGAYLLSFGAPPEAFEESERFRDEIFRSSAPLASP